MTSRMLAAAALAASLIMPSFALAQETAPLTKDHAPSEASGIAGDDASFFTSSDYAGFFTDDTMKTQRSGDEMKMAYEKLTPEQQAKFKEKCAAVSDQSFSDMCLAAKATN